MRILAIDTSSAVNVIGLTEGEHTLADFSWEARDNSLEKVIIHLDLVLKRGGIRLQGIEGIAVGIGPGSWTGVRVGVTVAKMLAYFGHQPVCGVTSLQALAFQEGDSSRLLVPLVDAGRDTIYAGFFRRSGKEVTSVGDCYAGGIRELVGKIQEPALFLGKAAHAYRQAIGELAGPLAAFGSPSDIRGGYVIAGVALSRFERGDTDDALDLAPLYLRDSLAQALLRRREEAAINRGNSIC